MRVMIVECNPVLGRVLKELVTGHGYAVSLACDGMSARTLVRAAAHDLLLLDRRLDAGDCRRLLESWRTWGVDKPVLELGGRGGSGRTDGAYRRLPASLSGC